MGNIIFFPSDTRSEEEERKIKRMLRTLNRRLVLALLLLGFDLFLFMMILCVAM